MVSSEKRRINENRLTKAKPGEIFYRAAEANRKAATTAQNKAIAIAESEELYKTECRAKEFSVGDRVMIGKIQGVITRIAQGGTRIYVKSRGKTTYYAPTFLVKIES